MLTSKADVWLQMYTARSASATMHWSETDGAAPAERDVVLPEDLAMLADADVAQFDLRFYAISGGGFGPRPKKQEGDPAPTITIPPAQS